MSGLRNSIKTILTGMPASPCAKVGHFMLPAVLFLSFISRAQPAITKQPVNNTRCAGLECFFEVQATQAVSWQWQQDANDGAGFKDVAGANRSYYAPKAQVSMTGYKFQALVKDANGAVTTSDAATLTVFTSPKILTAPSPSVACENEAATFTVAASGSGTLNYTWFQQLPQSEKFTKLEQANPTLRLADIALNMSGNKYWVEVTVGTCLSSTSDNKVSLTVNPAPAVTVHNPAEVCSPATIDLTDPKVTEGSAPGLTYSYFTDPAAANALTLPAAVATGGTYYIRGKQKSCYSKPAPVILTVKATPAVKQTVQETVCSGGDTGIILSNPNGGTNTLFKWTVSANPNITGAADQSTAAQGPIVQTLTNTSGTYQSVTYTVTPVASPCPDGTPVDFSVQVSNVTAPDVVTEPATISACSGTLFSVTLSSVAKVKGFKWEYLPADHVSGGISQTTLSPGPLTGTLTTDAFTAQTAGYLVTAYGEDCTGKRKKMSAQVKPLPAAKAVPEEVSICTGGNYDVALEDPTGVPGTQFKWKISAPPVLRDWQDQTTLTGGTMRVHLTSSSAQKEQATYTVTPVAADCPGTGIAVKVNVDAAVSITTQPASGEFCPGDKMELSVVAAGSGALIYQWQKNGKDITGASDSKYAIPALTQGDGGKYLVNISSGCATTPSNEAVITVDNTTFFAAAKAVISAQTIDYTGYADYTYTGPEAALTWDFGDQTKSQMAAVRHYYYKAGNFPVTLRAERNPACIKEFSVGTVTVGGPALELFTCHETRYGTGFYPNPVKDIFFIKSENEWQSAVLSDQTGQVVRIVPAGKGGVNIENLAPGLYYLQVRTVKNSVNLRLIKQ